MEIELLAREARQQAPPAPATEEGPLDDPARAGAGSSRCCRCACLR